MKQREPNTVSEKIAEAISDVCDPDAYVNRKADIADAYGVATKGMMADKNPENREYWDILFTILAEYQRLIDLFHVKAYSGSTTH